MVSVAVIGNTLWVCDPNMVSWVLEQPERLRSHDYKLKCHAQKQSAPTVFHYEKISKSESFNVF